MDHSLIHYWDPSSSLCGCGHVSLQIPGLYISVYPQKGNEKHILKNKEVQAKCYENVEEEIAACGHPSKTALILNLDTNAIRNWWDKYREKIRYHLHSSNCATAVYNALCVGNTWFKENTLRGSTKTPKNVFTYVTHGFCKKRKMTHRGIKDYLILFVTWLQGFFFKDKQETDESRRNITSESEQNTSITGQTSESEQDLIGQTSESEQDLTGQTSESEQNMKDQRNASVQSITGQTSKSEQNITGESSESEQSAIGKRIESVQNISSKTNEPKQNITCLTSDRTHIITGHSSESEQITTGQTSEFEDNVLGQRSTSEQYLTDQTTDSEQIITDQTRKSEQNETNQTSERKQNLAGQPSGSEQNKSGQISEPEQNITCQTWESEQNITDQTGEYGRNIVSQKRDSERNITSQTNEFEQNIKDQSSESEHDKTGQTREPERNTTDELCDTRQNITGQASESKQNITIQTSEPEQNVVDQPCESKKKTTGQGNIIYQENQSEQNITKQSTGFEYKMNVQERNLVQKQFTQAIKLGQTLSVQPNESELKIKGQPILESGQNVDYEANESEQNITGQSHESGNTFSYNSSYLGQLISIQPRDSGQNITDQTSELKENVTCQRCESEQNIAYQKIESKQNIIGQTSDLGQRQNMDETSESKQNSSGQKSESEQNITCIFRDTVQNGIWQASKSAENNTCDPTQFRDADESRSKVYGQKSKPEQNITDQMSEWKQTISSPSLESNNEMKHIAESDRPYTAGHHKSSEIGKRQAYQLTLKTSLSCKSVKSNDKESDQTLEQPESIVSLEPNIFKRSISLSPIDTNEIFDSEHYIAVNKTEHHKSKCVQPVDARQSEMGKRNVRDGAAKQENNPVCQLEELKAGESVLKSYANGSKITKLHYLGKSTHNISKCKVSRLRENFEAKDDDNIESKLISTGKPIGSNHGKFKKLQTFWENSSQHHTSIFIQTKADTVSNLEENAVEQSQRGEPNLTRLSCESEFGFVCSLCKSEKNIVYNQCNLGLQIVCKNCESGFTMFSESSIVERKIR